MLKIWYLFTLVMTIWRYKEPAYFTWRIYFCHLSYSIICARCVDKCYPDCFTQCRKWLSCLRIRFSVSVKSLPVTSIYINAHGTSKYFLEKKRSSVIQKRDRLKVYNNSFRKQKFERLHMLIALSCFSSQIITGSDKSVRKCLYETFGHIPPEATNDMEW